MFVKPTLNAIVMGFEEMLFATIKAVDYNIELVSIKLIYPMDDGNCANTMLYYGYWQMYCIHECT